MKMRSLFVAVLCAVVMGMAFAACSDDDKDKGDEGSTVQLPASRVFILSEGDYKSNDASITFYAPNGEIDNIADIYSMQNGEELGNLAQDIVKEGSDIFVILSGSKRLLRLNKSCVKQKELSFAGQYGDPRYMVEEDGKLYVTVYGNPGYVFRINASTLVVEDSVKVGNNPENVVEANDKLYVSNTGWGSGKTVSVIDIKTFKEIKQVEVIQNPNDLLEAEDEVYVISWGAYNPDTYGFDEYALQCIDRTDAVSNLSVKVSKMAEYEDVIYMAYNTYPGNKFFTYNAKTKQFNNESFLKDAPAELTTATIYMLKVNPYNGDIYIGTTDYTNNGDIYRFYNDGTFVEKFEAGMNPNNAIFF